MNTFAQAVVNSNNNELTRTTNAMKAYKTTANKNTDLFFKIGAMRGKDITPIFTPAYVENKELALRIAQWVRDVRQGAGERQIYRDILKFLDQKDINGAKALLNKTAELGRWDDLLVDFQSPDLRNHAFSLIKKALIEDKNGLAAKWMPRKGTTAVALRRYLDLSPKAYRKLLVNLTKVVEQQMCAKDWDNINFSHVPSVAAARYKKAFNRHTPKYAEYVQELMKPEDERTIKDVKVNAGAVYPYDVIKGLGSYYYSNNYNATELGLIQKQWEALPNYVGDANILPIVDVSGSMTSPAGGYGSKSKVTCLDVSVSLGLYLADKNKGKFKDTFLTFSGSPQLLNLKGNIVEKIAQMQQSEWGMNTNLHAALEKVLDVAVKNRVPQEEMPNILLILSDMQFDTCATYDDNAIEMIHRKYQAAGYIAPKVVFWNLNAHDNVPVKSRDHGTALVSGFSPSIVKAVLAGDLEEFTPESIMLKTVMVPRYDITV